MADEFTGKALSIEEYWAIIKRRRWLILGSVFVCWAAVWCIGWALPAQYESEALVLVEQQKVPETLVPANVSVSLQDRLDSMTQQILSRTRLQGIIDQFHLYPKHGAVLSLFQPSDPVDQMRKDISIELVQAPAQNSRDKDVTAFKIHYTAHSPQVAQQVDSELTSLFIDENMRSQQQLSQNTTAFFNNQLEQARQELEQQEAKVRAFKAQHMGELPDQLQSNVQILSGLQNQLESVQHSMGTAEQQKLYLNSIVQQYQATQGTGPNGEVGMTPEALDKQIKDLQLQLTTLRAQYTDNYPDVIAMKDQIAKDQKLKKQMEDEIAANQKADKGKKGKTDDAPVVQADFQQNGAPTPMMQMQSQLKANELQIESLQKTEKQLQGRIAEYQNRLNMTPSTEQALSDISRGYMESQKNYDSLLAKQNQSELATSLAQRQQGEQFRVIDPASLPDKPTSPNHGLISVGGLILGLASGITLTLLLELTDVRIRQEKDLEGVVNAKVLVGIPEITTFREEERHARHLWIERGAAVAIALLVVVGNIYAFYKG